MDTSLWHLSGLWQAVDSCSLGSVSFHVCSSHLFLPIGHGASSHRVISAGGGNFRCPIPGPASAAPQDDALAEFEDDLSRTIVDCEVNSSAWTLMHRYNKATELIDSVLNVSGPAVTWPSTLTCLHDLHQISLQPGHLDFI